MLSDGRDTMVSAGGHHLRVRWYAGRARPEQMVIVLLHEGLGSVTLWRAFPEQLAAATGAAVVGYDRRGHGASERLVLPRSPDFLDREAECALPDVLDALGLDRVVLYGHSDGGTIALLAAAALPDRVRAVVSEAAHVFSETASATGFAEVIRAFEHGTLRAGLARHHGDNVDSMFRGWADVWRSPAMQRWSMIDRLPAVRCPVLVVQGADDDHGSPEQAEAIVRGVSGSAEAMIVSGCGHAPHLAATDQVVARAARFLAERVSGA